MIPSSNRFHGRASIQRLYSRGGSVRTGAFLLRYAENPRRERYRLAVVVSRKVSKKAVRRNRIRRRVYENVRILSSDFQKPLDLAVLVYDEAVADWPAERLQTELKRLFKKAGLTSV